MRWNDYDFVLSADAQWNGGPDDYVPDLEAYARADLATEYQTALSPELWKVMRTDRHFQSIDHPTAVRIRAEDHRLGVPVEFFQCQLQKPQHYVDYRGRLAEFMDLVRRSHAEVNDVLDAAFREYFRAGIHPLSTIPAEVGRRFAHVDAEMRGILAGYLTQMPRRAIFLIDLESDPASWDWIEPVYKTIRWHLRNFGLDHIAVATGKGYHFVSQVPLYREGYGLPHAGRTTNYAMLNVMARGGRIHPETVDKCVSVRWKSRKFAPVPLLSQRAFQGMWRLAHFLLVNIVDDIRAWLWKAGRNPWVNWSDTYPETIVLDLTYMLRQAEMAVFGSVGSIYNKSPWPPKVRIVRARNDHEYFGDDIGWMLHTRSDLGAAKQHLIHAGGRIPDGTRGIENLIRAYDGSRIKRECHDPCDQPISPDRIAWLIRSNYADVRRRCPEIRNDLERAQPNFLTPAALDWVYRRMAARGYSIHEMMTLTKAVYCDPVKRVDIDPKYSKDEWARWPILLQGERFKG